MENDNLVKCPYCESTDLGLANYDINTETEAKQDRWGNNQRYFADLFILKCNGCNKFLSVVKADIQGPMPFDERDR
jgi:sarcosine oxidase delta subunit